MQEKIKMKKYNETWLEHFNRKSFRHLAKEMGVSKTSAQNASPF
jgi:hypothetical protein